MKKIIHVFAINCCFRLLITRKSKINLMNIKQLIFYAPFYTPVILLLFPLFLLVTPLLFGKFRYISNIKKYLFINNTVIARLGEATLSHRQAYIAARWLRHDEQERLINILSCGSIFKCNSELASILKFIIGFTP